MNIFEVLADLMARLASEFYGLPTGTECFAQPRHYGAILLWGLMWFMVGFTPTIIGLIKYQKVRKEDGRKSNRKGTKRRNK